MSKGLVLVTGAAGLVGQAVCSVLEKEGFNILPVLRRSGGSRSGLICDLTQPGALAQFDKPAVAIVHLAAAVPMAAEFPDTQEVADMTRAMDAAVLVLAERLQCPVLYASTCGLYRKVSDLPKVEHLPDALDPCTHYLRAKLHGERLFQGHGQSIIMRLSAPLGPGMRKTAIASRFIDCVRAGRPIQLWGSGARRQNFISVADIALFVRRALEGDVGGVFNVAAPRSISMRELAETVIDILGAGRIEYLPVADPNEQELADYDTTKAARLLGWAARDALWGILAGIKGEQFRI
jgi:nucleoside-diphosphate-sugar epimerase